MYYDPVKDKIMVLIKHYPWVRKLFHLTLDALFLRQWYVKKSIKDHFNVSDHIDFYDAGAGFCQYSDFLLTEYPKSTVFALDLKDNYLSDYARYAEGIYHGRFNWIKADLVEYVPPKSFDLIIAIDILEHIEDDLRVLRNFHKCMKSGGKLIISTPSDLDEAAKFTEEHVRPGYNPQELKDKLESTGFIIRSFDYSYGRYGKLSWLLSIKIPIRLLSYSNIGLVFLPFYYILLYPIIYLLMKYDINTKNKEGNGLIIVAEK